MLMTEHLKNLFTLTGRKLRAWFTFNDIVFIAAVAAVAYGIWQINEPAAFIVVGAFFVLLTTYGRFKS